MGKCPEGYKFGYEHDEYIICSDCPLYDECETEENRILQENQKIKSEEV